jgi:hypothetical protein
MRNLFYNKVINNKTSWFVVVVVVGAEYCNFALLLINISQLIYLNSLWKYYFF